MTYGHDRMMPARVMSLSKCYETGSMHEYLIEAEEIQNYLHICMSSYVRYIPRKNAIAELNGMYLEK